MFIVIESVSPTFKFPRVFLAGNISKDADHSCCSKTHEIVPFISVKAAENYIYETGSPGKRYRILEIPAEPTYSLNVIKELVST